MHHKSNPALCGTKLKPSSILDRQKHLTEQKALVIDGCPAAMSVLNGLKDHYLVLPALGFH